MNDSNMFYNIKEHGAAGDGRRKDTASIQHAVDACSAAGGGRVIVPPGEYLTGTFFLKDNVDLHLLPGALIKGSPDLDDYNPGDCFPQNEVFPFEKMTGAHLVIALEAKNVSISGRGTIDGNGGSFFYKAPERVKLVVRNGKRPGQMIYFCECVNVHVEGVTLENPPYWTCCCHGCRDVYIRGVRINIPRIFPTTDGIDLDCCRNVVISDCMIDSGDDCITFRGNGARLKNKDMPCENVSVANCVLSSPTSAFRFGVGDGVVRNCAVNNCVIRNTRTGMNFVSRYSPWFERGADIENILISNLRMDVCFPFWISSGAGAAGRIRNLVFHDMEITAESGSFICGLPAAPIRDITFRNIDLTVEKTARTIKSPPYAVNMREVSLGSAEMIPHVVYAMHAENLEFHGVKARRAPELEEVYDAFHLEK